MIDQIEDKEAKAKYIRKIMEQNIKATKSHLDFKIQNIENQKVSLIPQTSENLDTFVNRMTIVQKQRWYTKITLKINPNFQSTFIALIDSGADLNCIQEGLIRIVYFVKTSQRLSTASNVPLKVQYKIPQGHVCKDGICIKTSFLLVKNISHQIVLGTPFLTQLYPFYIDSKGLQTTYKNQQILFEFVKGVELKEINQLQDHINLLQQKQQEIKFLRKEIQYKKKEENLKSKQLQERIKQVQKQIENNLCSSIPNAFWNRKQYMVSLPYEKDFNEKQIPTKARSIQMSLELLEYRKKEINNLLSKKLIRPSHSP